MQEVMIGAMYMIGVFDGRAGFCCAGLSCLGILRKDVYRYRYRARFELDYRYRSVKRHRGTRDTHGTHGLDNQYCAGTVLGGAGIQNQFTANFRGRQDEWSSQPSLAC